MRSSLFLKVYMTLLAALAVVAVASAAFVRFGDDEIDRGWTSRRDAFVAAMLPAGDSAAEKAEIMRSCGLTVAPNPSEFGSTVARVLGA